MKLFIYAPDIFAGDAVGNHCFGVARSAARSGLDVELFSQRFDSSARTVRHVDQLFGSVTADDILFVSYSIYDDYLDQLLALPCRKLCYFHGITDPELLRAFEPRTAELCSVGIAQLPKLKAFNVLAANSNITAAELKAHTGKAQVAVVPPVFADMPAFHYKAAQRDFGRRSRNLLVVGRVVPHKRLEDVLGVVAEARGQGADITLTVVGTMPNYEYSKYLFNFGRELGVLEHVSFAGVLDDGDLFYCYDKADALLSMSLHEGFGVPALEAMHFGLPVFARSGTAIDEVAAGVGLFHKDEPLAAFAHRLSELLLDDAWRKRQEVAGKARALELLEQASDNVWSNLFTQATNTSSDI
ncbi:glycosyltransferase [Paraburkholderia fungorum]|uniref:Glycosyltransferase involved in cell wall biosynthesis n=1 Tax=Paraburkholderia fungorum TaxID=134537 RepID=A0AAW3V7S9_9BURK|nr:glycosyltransferase [Paraburkholderia fungorum]MBB4517816.1 glycosyltransferase involved in cell wall biosynthesis [Paraburkholderia fungorum]MBB6205785.1 glycosyltransferase involved in cell wall biosynthesis [Paraburkholderia fungorum]